MISEIVTLTVIAILLGISTSVGIGCSSITAVLLIIACNYAESQALALSFIFMMGGGLGATVVSYQRHQFKGRKNIDYELILLTLPMLMSGCLFGTILSHFLSQETKTLIFGLLMIYAIRVFYKEITQRRGQFSAMEISPLKTELLELRQDFNARNRLQEIMDQQDQAIPPEKLKILLHIYVYTILLVLLRGSLDFDSITGLESCHIGAWICLLLHFILSYLYCKSIAIRKFQIDVEKESLGYVFSDPSDKMSYNKMREAMFNGFLGGAMGACLAMSGGVVLVALWVRAGIDRNKIANSAPLLIFFGASISFFIAILQGLYDSFTAVVVYFTIGCLSSYYIKCLFVKFQQSLYSRNMQFSIMLLLTVTSLCTYLPWQYSKYMADPHEFEDFHSFC